jgi:hypothetical protein
MLLSILLFMASFMGLYFSMQLEGYLCQMSFVYIDLS